MRLPAAPAPARRSLPALAAGLASALALSACAPGRMALPKELNPQPPMEVKKEHTFLIFGLKKLTFGPYQVTGYKKGWTRTNQGGVGIAGVGLSAGEAQTKFQFTLTPDQGKPWDCLCGATASKTSISKAGFSMDLKEKSTLTCYFAAPDSAPAWNLKMELGDPKGMAMATILNGTLSDGTKNLSVEGTDQMEGTALGSGDPTGYTFKEESRVVGAVQVINKGRVWMDPASAPEVRPPLAMVSTALLLHQDLRKSLEKDE